MAEISKREARKSALKNRIQLKEKERTLIKQVRKILKKDQEERTKEETKILQEYPEAVSQVTERISKQTQLKDRLKEVEDEPLDLASKCGLLAEAIRNSDYVVVYTGAGISTAAKIPDYRGPSGVWTLLKKGQEIKFRDLSEARPTFAHMALFELYRRNLIRHVVSQNCDGLHLRSGLPQRALSEVHGSMYIEVCTACKPLCQYIRTFDVTEKTSLHRHKTGRKCGKCGQDLKDSIVHFGERGKLRWPLNWEGAARASKKADLILCLGSSLKVLKRYPCLWFSEGEKASIYIINLQWTPKDEQAELKINGKCDEVMRRVMDYLKIPVPEYEIEKDPVFTLATPLRPREEKTATTNRLTKEVVPGQITSKENDSSASQSSSEDTKNSCDVNISVVGGTLSTNEASFSVEKTEIKSDDSQESQGDSDVAEKKLKTAGGGWYGKGVAKIRKTKYKKVIK